MWKVRKPNLNDSMSDVGRFHKDGVIDDKDADALKRLITQYDSQEGMATEKQVVSSFCYRCYDYPEKVL